MLVLEVFLDKFFTWEAVAWAGGTWLFLALISVCMWGLVRSALTLEDGTIMALEKSIQRSVVKYARLKNLLAIKLSTLGLRGTAGWPDYLFLCPGARVFFVEFKKPGNKLTHLQKQRVTLLAAFGFSVYVVDNTALGRKVIDTWASPTSLTPTS